VLPRRWNVLLTVLALVTAAIPARAQPPATVRAHSAGATTIAVLPFANFTGRTDAVTRMMPEIYRHLAASGLPVVTAEELRPVLRRHRIRTAGQIGVEDARILGEELAARALVLGSLDFYQDTGSPEAGLSVRIVDIASMTVISAASAASTGDDFAGLFGLGRIDSIERLVPRVVDELFVDLRVGAAVERVPAAPRSGCARVALVPFDNRSEMPYAGAIVTNILLSSLFADNYVLLEPGAAYEHFVSLRVMPRGEIDLASLISLGERFDLCMVVTGDVDRYHLAAGESDAAQPELDLGARILDARSGQLLAAFDDERGGRDGERVFQMGRCRSLGQLTERSLRGLIERIDEERVGRDVAVE
jgi:hypothetical protein